MPSKSVKNNHLNTHNYCYRKKVSNINNKDYKQQFDIESDEDKMK